jgi:serine/threonine protein phosphatase PrpC
MSAIRVLEADFHLVGVPEALGYETDHRKTERGLTITTVLIRDSEDLILDRSMKIEFEIPSEYPSPEAGAIRVFPDNMEPFRLAEVVQKCPSIIGCTTGRHELIFPWMDDAKYPISVWFFTVRNLLQKKSGSSSFSPWATPFLQRHSFPHKNRFHRSTATSNKSAVRIITGVGRTRGKRPYMEDADFCFGTSRLSDIYPAVQVLGVLDGHGGQECALFVADELPSVISATARREGGTKSMSRGSSVHKSSMSGAALPEILYKSFLQVDAEFLRSTSHTSGSTACIMLFDTDSGRSFIGNTGDTRAVVCRGGKGVNITLDMKASDPEQVARVAAAGGHVAKGRVMGSLAVARALGDAQLKKGRNLKRGPWTSGREALIPDPEITSFRPKRIGDKLQDDEFVIIATDGLWDVMSSQQAVDAVRKGIRGLSASDSGKTDDSVQVCESDLSKIADSMASQAVQLGSMDNITVMIVYFAGFDDGENSDDEGATSDEEFKNVTRDSDSKGVGYFSTGSSQNVRSNTSYAVEKDITSLLENVPNKFTNAINTAPTKPSLYTAPIKEVSAKSRPKDDDLDMDFLLDDKNF